jgi:hypothetical protein
MTVKNKLTTIHAHHPKCPCEVRWDREDSQCKCPTGWPTRVCVQCWLPVPEHTKKCRLKGIKA